MYNFSNDELGVLLKFYTPIEMREIENTFTPFVTVLPKPETELGAKRKESYDAYRTIPVKAYP